MPNKDKRYDITCPHCGKQCYATRSILHLMGMEDGGRGICIYCNEVMKLVYNIEQDKMTATKDEEDIKNGKEETRA